MKRPSFRRLLGLSIVGIVGILIGAGWLLTSAWGRRQVEQLVRKRLAENSDLVLAPFRVEFSVFREFPHVTASLRHLQLTDTAYQHPVTVLRVGRADLRLTLTQLLQGRVQINHITLRDTYFRQYTDARGRDWGLHGRGPRRASASTPPDFNLDSLTLLNFQITDRNDLHHSGYAAHLDQARLTVRGRDGVAQVRGILRGELQYLRSGRGNLFEREPAWAQVRYQYDFGQRKGTFQRTHATLSGDTILVSGTHQAAGPGQPRGTQLNLLFAGQQPLVKVLRVALPNNLHRFLEGSSSPSRAHIRYTIRGLSGPTTRPRTVLRFDLRNAQMQWADSGRNIRRWDARGVFDNGPSHSPKTTYLSFQQCRIYSESGELDAALTVRDFTRPALSGYVRGRTDLKNLAAVVAPDLWKARGGEATLDLRLNGLLPLRPSQATPDSILLPLAARGTVTLNQASFTVPSRRVDMSRLNVRVRLQDSLWTLQNLTGRLNGMNLRADATTTYLLAYFMGQHPTTAVTGTFAVDRLYVPELRRLLVPPSRQVRPAPRPLPPGRTRNQELAARALNVLPPGLRLNIRLRCGRLLLPADTIYNLAATVRHNGHYVQLRDLRAQAWGGRIRGVVSWPTDTLNLQPVAARLRADFGTLNYTRLLRLTARRPGRPRTAHPDPTLREVLLAANGQFIVSARTVLLPGTENLHNLRLRLDKTATSFHVPYLTFTTSAGGRGHIDAAARLAKGRLASANANLNLQYATLDIQRLLQLLASLAPPAAPARSSPGQIGPRNDTSPLLDGTIALQVRVTADHVRYAVLRGSHFRLTSRLKAGRALLDTCSLHAFGGTISLRGRLQTDNPDNRHPLHAQMRLQQIQLPELFRLAEELNLDVLRADNIIGTMNCEADVRTALDNDFLPDLNYTHAYLKTDLRNLELRNVTAIEQALKFLRRQRTSHLYFEPVSPRFVLDGRRLLIPHLPLNSNLTDLAISGEYYLDGRANLYMGLSPMQALFGNNSKRIAQIKSGAAARQPSRGLVYVNLRRTPGSKYNVRLFKKKEQRLQQDRLLQQYRQQLSRQPLDTTLRLLQ